MRLKFCHRRGQGHGDYLLSECWSSVLSNNINHVIVSASSSSFVIVVVIITVRDKALRSVPSLMRIVTRSSKRQYLSYVFLRKIFGEGWLWLWKRDFLDILDHEIPHARGPPKKTEFTS